MSQKGSSRMGGRNARKAKRASALPENMKPVHPGLEGGLYKPLKSRICLVFMKQFYKFWKQLV